MERRSGAHSFAGEVGFAGATEQRCPEELGSVLTGERLALNGTQRRHLVAEKRSRGKSATGLGGHGFRA